MSAVSAGVVLTQRERLPGGEHDARGAGACPLLSACPFEGLYCGEPHSFFLQDEDFLRRLAASNPGPEKWGVKLRLVHTSECSYDPKVAPPPSC
eukprot:2718498-Rhodomonas_salina.1